MNSIKALVIKFSMIVAVFSIVLGYYGFTVWNIITASVLVTGVSYIIGDLYILPRFGNVTATIADVGIAFIVLWFIGAYLFGQPDNLVTASFIAAVVIGIGEILFHRYMQHEVLDEFLKPVNPDYHQQAMRMELGSQVDIKRDEDEKSNLTKEKDDFYNK